MNPTTVAAALMTLMAAQIEPNAQPARFGDFSAYWVAGKAFRLQEDLYDWPIVKTIEKQEGLSQTFPIRNPPWILPLLVPLSLLPFQTAGAIFCAINALLLVFLACVIGKWLGVPIFYSFVLGITFVPAAYCIGMSQLSIPVAAGAILYFDRLKQGQPFRAGIWLALCTLKPHIVGLLWIYVLFAGTPKQRVKAFTAFTATIGLLSLIAVVCWPQAFQCWLASFSNPQRGAATDFFSPTIGMWLRMLISETAPTWIQFIPAAMTGVLYIIVIARMTFARSAQSAMTGACEDPFLAPDFFRDTLFASAIAMPYGWNFDYTLLLPIYLSAWASIANWNEPIPTAHSPVPAAPAQQVPTAISSVSIRSVSAVPFQRGIIAGLLLFELAESMMLGFKVPERFQIVPILGLALLSLLSRRRTKGAKRDAI